MKKKNILTIALSLCLAAVIAVGGTLAYFTSNTDQKQNAFTTGNVKIELVDETPGGPVDAEKPDGQQMVTGDKDEVTGNITYEDVMPGDVISKKVGVNLDADSENAWIAIKVDVTAATAQGSTLTEEVAKAEIWRLIDDQVDEGVWKKESMGNSSAVYYLRTSAAPKFDDNGNAITNVLFDRLVVPGEEWGNEYADISFSINVQAFAVQEKNLTGPDVENSTAVEQIKALMAETPSLQD